MTTRLLKFQDFQVEPGPEWRDITHSLKQQDMPYTIAKDDGMGALQFSVRLYRGGAVPSRTIMDLHSMVMEYGQRNQLGVPFVESAFQDSISGVGASFHVGADFVRIWCLSDMANIAFATYVCEWSHREREVDECEQIVRSLRFVCRSELKPR